MRNDIGTRDAEAVERTVALLRAAGAAAPTIPAAVLALVEAAESLSWALPDDLPADVARAVGVSLTRARELLATYSDGLATCAVAGRA